MNFSSRLSIAALFVLLSSCGLLTFPASASDVCVTFDGGARADTALTMQANFNNSFSGCGTTGTCEVTVSGTTVYVDAGAIVCSTGTNPGGVTPGPAPCSVPPLAPGTYAVSPFGTSFTVVADGGGSTSCP